MFGKEEKQKELLEESQYIEDPKSLSKFFREKGILLQEKVGTAEDSFSLYPHKKIADNLNISVEVLRNKLYGKKPLTRDWLVAICAAYGLNAVDTSEAMAICSMPSLDDGIKREDFIVNFLNEHEGQSVNVFDFNKALDKAELPVLEISFRKRKNESSLAAVPYLPYREISPKVVRTYGYEGDPYNSLTTEYLPKMSCVAEVWIENDCRNKFLLKAHSDGLLSISKEDDIFPETMRSIEPEHEFYKAFSELIILARKQKQRLDDVLNDTKNYKSRFSAKIKNDRIHIFYEEFNYSMPERNEYYLMEYVDGQYTLSVAKQSMFMQEYLSPDDFYEHYHTYERIPRKTYYSVDEIETLIEGNSRNRFYPDLLKHRKGTFLRLQQVVYEKLEAIRKREVFVQNFDYIWDTPYEVLSYYEIEKQFECIRDAEDGLIVKSKDVAEFVDDKGNTVVLSFKEIKQAFELGVKNIDDICRIKHEKGEIEAILS